MPKFICPAHGCGKKFITAAHAKSHADIAHPTFLEDSKMRRGWVTPYGFADFQHPVSYDEACEIMKTASEKMFSKMHEVKNGTT